MEWDILKHFAIYTPVVPKEMELEEICFTSKAKTSVSLALCLEKSLQTGCQKILHTLFFWGKASIYEKKEEKKKPKPGFFILPCQ